MNHTVRSPIQDKRLATNATQTPEQVANSILGRTSIRRTGASTALPARTLAWTLARAMRPVQWLKNGLVFAGLVFGGKLFMVPAVGHAVLAAIAFCLLSSGFYLMNDVRDMQADRLHPDKKMRAVASGALSPSLALAFGALLIVLAFAASAFLGRSFFVTALAYATLMTIYNLGLKDIVIVDVLAIAAGFVLRAVAGAVAVAVSISPWLLLCSMLLALLVGFGKRRYELVALEDAAGHRRNLDVYSRSLLDQAVAVTAAGTLVAYAIYTFDSDAAPHDHRMMLTIPMVAYGVFRYLYLLYQRGQGGTPEAMLLADRSLLTAITLWSFSSAAILYFAN